MRFISGLILVLTAFIITSCSTKPCDIEERTDKTMTAAPPVKPASNTKDLTKRVFISKADGSLQCGQGKRIDINEMKKELAGIEVFSSGNKHDGLMRIQLCGHPTGQNNVYEISESDLEKALKLGFKKWLRD